MINVEWDAKSWEYVDRLVVASMDWSVFEHNVANELATKSKDYMRPLMHVRKKYTGALENSLNDQISFTGDGFDITFDGLFYGLYMDNGNFDPSQMIYAADYGYKVFPVDRRLGEMTPMPSIHGMGSIHPEAPTHYSEKTLAYLASGGVAVESLVRNMSEFIATRVVGS